MTYRRPWLLFSDQLGETLNNLNNDTAPTLISKELVPIYKRGEALDMATFEREIGRILNKMRTTGRRDEDTETAIVRAVDTYEAAQQT